MNFFSIFTASVIIAVTNVASGLPMRQLKSLQANCWCSPSSRDISSFAWDRPGINPRDLNQYMMAKDEEKKIPSTVANAASRKEKGVDVSSIHLRAHMAFSEMHSMVDIALNIFSRSSGSSMKASIMFAYTSAWTFSLYICQLDW